MTATLFYPSRWPSGLGCAVVLVLSACGGGSGDGSEQANTVQSALADEIALALAQQQDQPGHARTREWMEAGAQLNTEELQKIAKTGELPEPFGGPLLSGAEGSTPATLNPAVSSKSLGASKSAGSRVPAYRFYNSQTSAHFYTTSITERDNVIANLPQFNYEGPAFQVSAASVPGLSPVHRFLNTQTGVHFYTISEAERANVAANLPQFNYEGIGYYASTLPGTGYTPLYRFFVSAQGFHFYTNSVSERDNIIATLPQYSYEGIAYYVLSEDWQTPAVPHTGVLLTQCYAAGSNTLVSCFGVNAYNLNRYQDGYRTTVNPMSYSPVSGQSSADCMRDNVTGLVWEVKAAAGVRASSHTYRRTLGFVGDPTTTGAYVSTVNSMNLCGFNDWRLPTMEELHGLLHFGNTSGPRITTSAFPNTQEANYWTLTDSSSSDIAWYVNFDGGPSSTSLKSALRPVRLVRGPAWTGPRYLVTNRAYPGDAPNNAVIDRRTGLTWRRCLEGQVWGGASCSGMLSRFVHEQALSYSRSGWRLPNVKELASLASRSDYAPSLDATAFPGASDLYTWSTTPYVSSSQNAWRVNFYAGLVEQPSRDANDVGLRLVHTDD